MEREAAAAGDRKGRRRCACHAALQLGQCASARKSEPRATSRASRSLPAPRSGRQAPTRALSAQLHGTPVPTVAPPCSRSYSREGKTRRRRAAPRASSNLGDRRGLPAANINPIVDARVTRERPPFDGTRRPRCLLGASSLTQEPRPSAEVPARCTRTSPHPRGQCVGPHHQQQPTRWRGD